jgi:chalcone isomerase-like protein
VRLLGLAALLASMSVVASAAEVAGIKLDERTKLGTCDLVLNGAGLRRKAFFRIYVAGLYLTERRTSPADVLALAGPKRASITLMRNLPARDLADALRDGIRQNSSPEEQQAVKGRIDELTANLVAIRQCKKGDVITVDWLPAVGTLVVLNGEVKGKPIPGYDVYSALLRVWLGDRPTSASLKKALLGQTD